MLDLSCIHSDSNGDVQINDKKLKGKMRHTERLNSEAATAAAKTDEWLLPAEAGTLEAEGMERTWRFSQVQIIHASFCTSFAPSTCQSQVKTVSCCTRQCMVFWMH